MRLPLVHELTPPPPVEQAFLQLASKPGVILFDSALRNARLGRYSFLSASPIWQHEIQTPEYGKDPFAPLRSRMQGSLTPAAAGLPPFQGGIAGLLSYDLGRAFERLPPPAVDEFRIPALVAGFYDWVLAWDHLQQRVWLIVTGDPQRPRQSRVEYAHARLAEVRDWFASPPTPAPAASTGSELEIATPHHPHPRLPDLTSNFSREQYLQLVERVIEYIHAGDIFQANLSQRLLFPNRWSPPELYLRLRRANPAPFAGYFSWDDWTVLSSSPERFLQLTAGEVRTRPIKGTRRRRAASELDLFTQDELQASEKDLAENVMIVDLLRNDLSRVCRPGSVHVPLLCSIESYATVHHLVSEVCGTLRPDCDVWDLFAATFPGGSITGAPKVRAMEIISELEGVSRGPYCGALFYVGLDGACDSNILIRTLTRRGGWLQLPAGGGIVARSDPAAEYDETLHKAEGLLRALRPETPPPE